MGFLQGLGYELAFVGTVKGAPPMDVELPVGTLTAGTVGTEIQSFQCQITLICSLAVEKHLMFRGVGVHNSVW